MKEMRAPDALQLISVCTFCCPADRVFGWLVGWGCGGWCVACGSFHMLAGAGTGGGARPWVVLVNCPTRPGQQYSFANLVCFSLWKHCRIPQHYLWNLELLLRGEPHEISFNITQFTILLQKIPLQNKISWNSTRGCSFSALPPSLRKLVYRYLLI